MGFYWAGPLTETDLYKVPPLKIGVLTEAAMLTLTDTVNLVCEAVFLTAFVNKK